jgi:nuclear factor NF-kappa-B p105 subunit
MGIIHTKKPKIKEELIRKLSEEKYFENGSISNAEMAKIEEKAENQSKEMNLNQVCLCFQAYIHSENEGRWVKICEPVYTNVINNMKSALVGELRICRMSSYTSPAAGKQEIFMFVEKVCKSEWFVLLIRQIFEHEVAKSANLAPKNSSNHELPVKIQLKFLSLSPQQT